MRSAAGAIGWELRQGHGWVLIALAGYALVLGAVKILLPGAWEPATTEGPPEIAPWVMVPFSTIFLHFLAVFSFGLGGDLAARQSIYPARLFTLPVTTAALAFWPMLYGALAMASLWLATVLLAVLPLGLDLPLLWPGVLAVVFLAWTQALMWRPYGLKGLRVIVAVLWLTTLDAIVLLALHYEVPGRWMVAFLAPQLPLAYFAARLAVARARRGEVPDGRGILARLGKLAEALPRRRGPFPSPAAAQTWFEWRRQGWRLPASMALLLPFELALLFVASSERPGFVLYTLLGVLLTPPLMAAFAATTVSTSSPEERDAWGVSPFDATRPSTSAALVGAQLKGAMWSTLAAWLLVLIAIPLALTGSATWQPVIERTGQWIEAEGTLRVVASLVLVFLALLGWTWKQLVQNRHLGLTGREWLIKAGIFFTLSCFILIGPLGGWILSLLVMAMATDASRWIAAGLIGLKVSIAAWIATRLHRQRLVSARTLVTVAAGWLVVVLALYRLLDWLVTTPLLPRYLLALVAVLAIPLARLSAAPLALAGNRHRRPARPAMKTGKWVLRAVLVIGLPVVAILGASVPFFFLDRTTGAIVSSGEKREYLLHVPSSYDRARPVPLVISLHGGGSWPAYLENTSRWSELAEEQGFLVVYPAGSDAPKSWHVGRGAGLMDDVRFLSELIDTLEAAYNIDPARIYANGLSNGAGMTFVLSCTLSDRIAAVGMVAAAHSLPWSWCKDERPVPMIAFHGTADALTSYHGGRSPAFPQRMILPSIPTWTANWARRNRCGTSPVESVVAADVTRLEYTGCADDAAVVLYTVQGGGHTWPGGRPMPEWLTGVTSNGVDATRQMWAFFREHPLPGK
ncbi:MAG TPA: PHB depolymerase family esterase [Thermoanaerobaculia bacterium]|nr:PHB depolymerase family esterase [Thermoanaerobaculia bacterium]